MILVAVAITIILSRIVIRRKVTPIATATATIIVMETVTAKAMIIVIETAMMLPAIAMARFITEIGLFGVRGNAYHVVAYITAPHVIRVAVRFLLCAIIKYLKFKTASAGSFHQEDKYSRKSQTLILH